MANRFVIQVYLNIWAIGHNHT